MRRFKEGDLAITRNSRAPLINDGHLVTILEVAGPIPECRISFGYLLKRVDGEPFAVTSSADVPVPRGSALQVYADQSKLRPLRRRPEDSRTTKEKLHV